MLRTVGGGVGGGGIYQPPEVLGTEISARTYLHVSRHSDLGPRGQLPLNQLPGSQLPFGQLPTRSTL